MSHCILAAGASALFALYFLPDLYRRPDVNRTGDGAAEQAGESHEMSTSPCGDSRSGSSINDTGASEAPSGSEPCNEFDNEEARAPKYVDHPTATGAASRRKTLKAVRFELSRNTWISPQKRENN